MAALWTDVHPAGKLYLEPETGSNRVRPKKWESEDFNMLFDRLYLKKRIEDIANQYSYTESAVQRRTARLTNILQLNLPKAPHKKHRRN